MLRNRADQFGKNIVCETGDLVLDCSAEELAAWLEGTREH